MITHELVIHGLLKHINIKYSLQIALFESKQKLSLLWPYITVRCFLLTIGGLYLLPLNIFEDREETQKWAYLFVTSCTPLKFKCIRGGGGPTNWKSVHPCCSKISAGTSVLAFVGEFILLFRASLYWWYGSGIQPPCISGVVPGSDFLVLVAWYPYPTSLSIL